MRQQADWENLLCRAVAEEAVGKHLPLTLTRERTGIAAAPVWSQSYLLSQHQRLVISVIDGPHSTKREIAGTLKEHIDLHIQGPKGTRKQRRK